MSEAFPTVLVVEDEHELRRFVRMSLEREGFKVHTADGMTKGLIEAATQHPDLMILDLGLPDGDGVALLRDLRTWSDMPVVVLSARTTEEDKINALDKGADDYLVKPFSPRELIARVRAHLRRRTNTVADGSTVIKFGDVTVDLVRRSVQRHDEEIHLTPVEYRLLTYLTSHPHCVITHQQLLSAVWSAKHANDTHYARVYMSHLRRKIEEEPSKPRHLLTETGIGYRFVP